MQSALSSRYAKALVDVVMTPRGGVDAQAVLSQLRAVEQVIAGAPDLRTALLSPAVSPPRKRAVIEKVLAPLGLSKAVRNFLFVVIDHRRVDEFSSIVDAFETLLDEQLGFVRADVWTARPLGDTQQAALEREISRVAGKKAKLKFSTDPALIAGVVARIGSTVYDGSVRGQLDKMRARLAKA
jgi:F-type H+-transporting ATPase subunit delta